MEIIELFRYKIYNLRLKLYVKSEIFFSIPFNTRKKDIIVTSVNKYIHGSIHN